MEITGVRAELLEVNCYAVAAESVPGHGTDSDVGGERECILVDAGFDCAPDLERTLREFGWRPVAVLLTHGHPDHILGLPNLLAAFDLEVYIGAPDLYRLQDPAATVSAQLAALVGPLADGWQAPAATVVDGTESLRLAGLTITPQPAPGHTEGSTLWRVRDPAGEGDAAEVLFTGDVLFAGSIGRTDLAGGDAAAMQRTLEHLKTLPDTPVLPGHGPASRISHELRTNPFL
ncbi:MBL fold metallo-hydrolase [Brevibacterium daeguense]|uniref:MBL fold metallo-hydrolase n=1 Tax=Brevibacterium daeguense TaxID=909936 RepID=A0ABP8EN16_9MICO|nr:MBL fold metallo-hydrolase [Brevibacterium daeguense]